MPYAQLNEQYKGNDISIEAFQETEAILLDTAPVFVANVVITADIGDDVIVYMFNPTGAFDTADACMQAALTDAKAKIDAG
jgi:hypothetical protein